MQNLQLGQFSSDSFCELFLTGLPRFWCLHLVELEGAYRFRAYLFGTGLEFGSIALASLHLDPHLALVSLN